MFRIGYDRPFSASDVQERLELDELATATLVEELLKRGWIQEVVRKPSSFELTDDGRFLCAAKSIPRISRAKAERILAGFMRRVHEINNNDDFGVYVEEVWVFGSCLESSNDDLGNVNLNLTLNRRPIVGRDYRMHAAHRQEVVGLQGWFHDFLEYEVYRHLKAKNQYLSIRFMGSARAMAANMSLFYRAPKMEGLPREHRGEV